MRLEGFLVLLAGLAMLYAVLGTSLVINRYRMMALPPARRLDAVTYKAIVLGGVGLVCVTLSSEFLIFGNRPLPYLLRATQTVLWLVILGSAAVKRVRSR